MEQVPRTRSKPWTPSQSPSAEEMIFTDGVVKGEENIINFLIGYRNE
jgi:hypothetical protein